MNLNRVWVPIPESGYSDGGEILVDVYSRGPMGVKTGLLVFKTSRVRDRLNDFVS